MQVARVVAGRLFQKGDVMAFGSIHRRARGAGAISTIGGFAVGVLRFALLVFDVCLFQAQNFVVLEYVKERQLTFCVHSTWIRVLCGSCPRTAWPHASQRCGTASTFRC
jgi:hypothetical protein